MLSADECEEAGLDVIPLPSEIREELRSRGMPIWDWIANPLDESILDGFGITGIDMLQIMAKNRNFDFIIANMHEGPLLTLYTKEKTILMLRSSVEGYVKAKKESNEPLLVVLKERSPGVGDCDHWAWELICELRTKLIAANIPFYPTIGRAAGTAKKLIDYYQKRK